MALNYMYNVGANAGIYNDTLSSYIQLHVYTCVGRVPGMIVRERYIFFWVYGHGLISGGSRDLHVPCPSIYTFMLLLNASSRWSNVEF